MAAKASSELVTGSSLVEPLVEVTRLMREAKERMSTEFLDWMMGRSAVDPYKVPVEYGTLVVSGWNRAGFSEVNYGGESRCM